MIFQLQWHGPLETAPVKLLHAGEVFRPVFHVNSTRLHLVLNYKVKMAGLPDYLSPDHHKSAPGNSPTDINDLETHLWAEVIILNLQEPGSFFLVLPLFWLLELLYPRLDDDDGGRHDAGDAGHLLHPRVNILPENPETQKTR